VLHGAAGLYFPQFGGKINPGLSPTSVEDRHISTRSFSVCRENKAMATNRTQEQELKEHEKKRDIFCVVSDAFRVFARRTSIMLGSAWAFVGALFIIAVWAITGPTFHFSDTWQLIINTGTTIVTFLMVFLIQNTQNRDAKAMHLKLDEVIRALKKARNELVDVEDLSDEELNKLEEQFKRVRKKAEDDGTQLSRHAEPKEVR
jgi:low affinity Fe/Cu permease